jgi:X-X-X-Leu-X-X-Gly heptad repeat protein
MSLSGLSAAGSTIYGGVSTVRSGAGKMVSGVSDIASGVVSVASGLARGVDEAGDAAMAGISLGGEAIARAIGGTIDTLV